MEQPYAFADRSTAFDLHARLRGLGQHCRVFAVNYHPSLLPLFVVAGDPIEAVYRAAVSYGATVTIAEGPT